MDFGRVLTLRSGKQRGIPERDNMESSETRNDVRENLSGYNEMEGQFPEEYDEPIVNDDVDDPSVLHQDENFGVTGKKSNCKSADRSSHDGYAS